MAYILSFRPCRWHWREKWECRLCPKMLPLNLWNRNMQCIVKNSVKEEKLPRSLLYKNSLWEGLREDARMKCQVTQEENVLAATVQARHDRIQKLTWLFMETDWPLKGWTFCFKVQHLEAQDFSLTGFDMFIHCLQQEFTVWNASSCIDSEGMW